MIECSGKAYFFGDTVTGRLCSVEHQGVCDSEAKILWWDGKLELSDTAMSSAVGVVFQGSISESFLNEAVKFAEFYRMPLFRINSEIPQVEMTNKGSIAILDTFRHKLFINPDLETVSRFLDAQTGKEKRSHSRLLEYSEGSCLDTYDGIVLPPKNEMDGETFYEYLCDIADRYTGYAITARVDFCGEDQFAERVRAVYRAGIWGRFSILCTSVRTAEDTDRCISLMHKAFCSLDREGREFNGFIPKGICVDTPLMLLSQPRHSMIDLFCVDFERLRFLVSGSEEARTGEAQTLELVREFASKLQNAELALAGIQNVSKSVLEKLFALAPLKDIYVSK